MTTVMIVTGESSGELYGSLLAKALKTRWPELHIIGIGGERMGKEGVTLISRTTDAFGLMEAVSSYRKVKTTFKKAVDALKEFFPDVLVLIDYPDFNIRLARIAKDLRIKVLYYVSPQVWAWRKGRVKKIAQIVDRMAVLFPFEEEIYKKAGVACEFVGHPIFEEIEAILESMERTDSQCRALSEKFQNVGPEFRIPFKTATGLDSDRPVLSLLPGSRPHELKRHLPLIIKIVKRFKNDPEIYSGKNYQFCVPLSPNTDEGKYTPLLKSLLQEGVIIRKGESVRVLAASDAAVVTSGTATLQTAFLEVPMVVVYKLSPLTYQLGKRIVKVKYISLVNILSGRRVVKELIQEKANTENIVKELKKILFKKDYREDMISAYRKIKKQFSGKNTSYRVAEIIMDMTSGKK